MFTPHNNNSQVQLPIKKQNVNFPLFLCLSRIRDKELQHPKDDLGREGKYRRTSSPTICSTPNVRPSSAASQQSKSQNFKSPAKTPKRDSPATIAAKGIHIINLFHREKKRLREKREISFYNLPCNSISPLKSRLRAVFSIVLSKN